MSAALMMMIFWLCGCRRSLGKLFLVFSFFANCRSSRHRIERFPSDREEYFSLKKPKSRNRRLCHTIRPRAGINLISETRSAIRQEEVHRGGSPVEGKFCAIPPLACVRSKRNSRHQRKSRRVLLLGARESMTFEA